MSVQSYFYDQRRKHPPQKRNKKSSDDYSLFGEHRSFNKAIRKKISLTFSDQGDLTDGAGSTVNSAHGIATVRPKSGKKRPGTPHSVKQLSPTKEATPKISPNALLPQISSNLSAGPTSPTNIVSQPSKHSTKVTDIRLTPAKLKVLEAVESEKPEEDGHQRYTFSELKFLATGILSQLSKLLCNYKLEKDLCIISEELASDLFRDFYQLCCDVVVEKREWQTDCYLDQQLGTRPFFTSVPEEEERLLIESNLKKAEAVHTLEQKKVKMSDTAKKTSKTYNRPGTSRSRASLHSAVSSDFGPFSTVEDDKESRLAPSEYDLLPSSLCPRGPTILSYKRESLIKPLEFAGPKTRFEKFKQNLANKRAKSKSVVTLKRLLYFLFRH